MSMMLLGKCPRCGREDTICQPWHAKGNPADCCKVNCNACSTSWYNWLILTREEGGKGNELIPIEIEYLCSGNIQQWGIQLAWLTIYEIPFYELIVSFFNTALIVRYGLGHSLRPKGGIEGYYKGSEIELLNNNDHLGLNVAKNKPRGEGAGKILDFYHLLLHYLFEAESLGTGQFRRGEILRLPRSQEGDQRARKILTAVLSTAMSNGFAREVGKMTTGSWPKPHSYSVSA